MLQPVRAVPEERENKKKTTLTPKVRVYTLQVHSGERERPDRGHMVPVSVTCEPEGSHVTF